MTSKERHRKYNLQYYHNKRNELISQLGGKCVMCGSTTNLEFDHKDKNTKCLDISKHMQYSTEYLYPQLQKCQLLCNTCHIRKTKQAKDNKTKIDKDIALDICKEYAISNITQKELGKKYGIAQTTISSIIRGTRWTTQTIDFDRSVIPQNRSKGSIFAKTAVDKIDPATGLVIRTYQSINQAAKEGHKSGAISRCCSNKLKSHHGFIWRKHKE